MLPGAPRSLCSRLLHHLLKSPWLGVCTLLGLFPAPPAGPAGHIPGSQQQGPARSRCQTPRPIPLSMPQAPQHQTPPPHTALNAASAPAPDPTSPHPSLHQCRKRLVPDPTLPTPQLRASQCHTPASPENIVSAPAPDTAPLSAMSAPAPDTAPTPLTLQAGEIGILGLGFQQVREPRVPVSKPTALREGDNGRVRTGLPRPPRQSAELRQAG